jgi:uncharacterized protein involved in cysteine biosynthesis
MISRYFLGFGFVIEGIRLFKIVPGIKKWIFFPLIIAFVLFIGGLYLGGGQIDLVVQQAILGVLDAPGGRLYQILYYPLVVLFWLVFVVLYVYVLYIGASLISSPFYSIIAEKTLIHLGLVQPAPFSMVRILRLALKMFFVSLLRSLALMFVGLFLLVSSFIPGVNLLSAYFAFVILALDSADYSFETRGFGFRDRLQFFKTHFPEVLGMGGFIGLTVLVPGLILLVMPFAVLGAAGLMLKLENKKISEA